MKKHIFSLTITLLSLIGLQAQQFYINEDFNARTLPTGWDNTPLVGNLGWQFGLDGSLEQTMDPDSNNVDGTMMAFFDDNTWGKSTNNTPALTTPAFNNQGAFSTILKFNYNLREDGNINDSLYVEVFDGTNWNVVWSVTVDDCGKYNNTSSTPTLCQQLRLAGMFPSATINIAAYGNANCKVRFVYHDGNNWGYYAAIDNVTITAPISNDIAVTELVSPLGSSCGLSSTQQALVKIVNRGSIPAAGFDIGINVDNGAQVISETVLDTIKGGDSLIYQMTNTMNLSALSTYDLDVYVTWAQDGSAVNDTLRNISVTNEVGYNLTYIENFENGAGDWVVSGGNASWEVGLPSATFISFSGQGNNAFVTNLNGRYNSAETGYLISPCLDFSTQVGDPVITFDLIYDFEGVYDSLFMESSIDNGVTWQRVKGSVLSQNWYNIKKAWGSKSAGWLKVENVLTGLGGQGRVKLRFATYTDGGTNLEGAGVDRIAIRFPTPIDLGINQLNYPTSGPTPDCGYGEEFIEVDIENKGATEVSSFVLAYKIGNNSTVRETVNIPIQPNVIRPYVFNTPANFAAAGTYFLNVWIEAAGDGSSSNDSIQNERIVNVATASAFTPYKQSFENRFAPGSEPSNTNSSIDNTWTRPTAGFTWQVANSGAFLTNGTGPASDHTGGNGNFIYAETTYPNPVIGDVSYLESPCLNFVGKSKVTLEYWSFRFGSNPSPIYLDVFDGRSWIIDVDSNKKVQSGRLDAWKKHTVNLDAYAGKKLRLRFRAVYTGSSTGDVAIDDIIIYEPIEKDAEILSINAPTSDCAISENSQVTIDVRNFGIDTIDANELNVYYMVQVPGDTSKLIVKDTVNTRLLPGEELTFNFSEGADLSIAAQEYYIRAWVDVDGDSNVGNDSITDYSVTNYTRGPGYRETFESINFLDGSCLNPYNDLVAKGWTRTNTNFTWNVQDARTCRGGNGATATGGTGPNGDHTTGNGKFLYTEANLAGGVAEITSPCIDFRNSTGAAVAFWYHRFGSAMGTLYVDIIANGIEYLGVDTLVGQGQTAISDPWRVAGVNLGQFAGQLLQVRFRGVKGATALGDMAIDDVEFYEPIPQDARVSAVTSPVTECSPSNVVTILVENFGLDTIVPNAVTVWYSVNGGPPVSDVVTQGVGVGRSVIHSFGIPGEFSAFNTTFTIRAWTRLAGDTNVFNDSSFYQFTNITQGLNYRENFETFVESGCDPGGDDVLTRGWFATPKSSSNFHWSVQNAGACGGTPTPGSGPRVDATRGNGNFMYAASNLPGSVAYLQLPCVDFAGLPSAGMTFDYHMYGSTMGTLSVEVYNDITAQWDSVFGITGQQQTTSSDPWREGAAKFEEFAGKELQIRFKARKGGTNSDMAIDDIAFYLPQPIDARSNAVLSPRQGCEVFDYSIVSVQVENFGTSTIPINTLNLYYQVGKEAPVMEPFPDSLEVDEIRNYVFTQTADLSELGKTYNIRTWTEAVGEGNIKNDTLFNYFVVNQSKRTNYFEDFERFQDPGCAASVGQVTANGWTIPGQDLYNWHVQNSICGSHNDLVTPSANTGPTGDHTSGNGTFLYTEAGDGGASRGLAIFESPCIDLQPNTQAHLSFWYHMYGSNTGRLRFQVLDNGVWNTEATLTGQQQTSENADWKVEIVDLNNYVGETVLIRFIADDGNGNNDQGDIAIDDIAIYEPSSTDIAITGISAPGDLDACGLTNTPVTIRLTNTGTDPISTDIPVQYRYFGSVYKDTVKQIIGAGNSTNFTFTNTLDLSAAPGVQELVVLASLPGDTISFNNSARKEINNRTPGLPRYFMDFDNHSEGDLQGWRNTPAAGYSWNPQCGAGPNVDGMPMAPPWPNPPTGPSGDHTHSTTVANGEGCYMRINSDMTTNNIPDALLELPCGTIDFSNSRKNKILLSFWYHMFGDNTGDLYVDVHDGIAWRNRVDVIRGEQQGDDTERWIRRQVSLDAFAGLPEVKIRFRAEWDTRGGDISIDDIEILDRAEKDARMVRIVDPATDCDLTASERFRVQFQNMGTSDILETILGYQITFTPYKGEPEVWPIVKDTAVGISGYVAPLAFQYFEFERVDMSAPGKYEIKFWPIIDGDTYYFNDTIIETIENETRPFPNCEDFSDMIFGQEPKAFRDGRYPSGWEGNPSAYAFKTAISGASPTDGHIGGTTDPSLYSPNRKINNVFLMANDADGMPGQIARIESPCYDLTNTQAAILEFYYQAPNPNHFMVIEAQQVGSAGWAILDTLYGAGNGIGGIFQWTKQSIVLTDFVGGFVKVRFRCINQGGGYYALDDFCILRPPPQQIELERFVTPSANLCFYSDSEIVRLRFNNVGLDRITNFKVVLAIDKTFQSFPPGNFFRDTIDVSINSAPFFDPGDKYDLVLSDPSWTVDMFDRGESFFFNAYTILPGDVEEANNFIEDYTVGHPVPLELPYTEDFELIRGEGVQAVYSNGMSTARSGTGFYFWEEENQLEVFRDQWTGPAVDHTKGTSKGTYMITNASALQKGDGAAFTTRCVNLQGTINPEIRYWYYMFGHQIGEMSLQINDDHGWVTIDALRQADPDQRTNFEDWKSRTIDLLAYAGKVVRFRFVSIRGDGTAGSTAVDDISVYDLAAKDIAVANLSEPIDDTASCYTAEQQVKVNLRNNGSQSIDFTVDTAIVKVEILKDGVAVPESPLIDTIVNNDFRGSELPRDSITTIIMTETFDMSDTGKVFRFVVSVDMKGDVVARNDVYDVSVKSQRVGGQVFRVIPNDTVCGGTIVQLKLRNHYGSITWEERVNNPDGLDFWLRGLSFPIDSAYYNTIPDTTTRYRAKICDVDMTASADTVYSTDMEVVVINVPKPIGLNGSRCDTGVVTVRANVPVVFPPITRVRMWDSLKPVNGGTIIADRAIPFGFVDTYYQSDTFFLESVVETKNVRGGFCVSKDRDTVIANVNTVPDPIMIDTNLINVCVPTPLGLPRAGACRRGIDQVEVCRDSSLILDASRVDGRQDTYEWTIINPDGSITNSSNASLDSIPLLRNQTIVVDAWLLGANEVYGFTVVVTSDSGCVNRMPYDTIYVTIRDSCVTSLAEVSFKDNFSIYPNPVSEELFVTHSSTENFIGSIRLMTVEGQLIQEVKNIGFGRLNYRFDMGELPKGIYIIKVQTERGSFVEKIIRS